MKKFFSFLAVSLTLVLGLSLSSCTQDLCKDVTCGNGNCDAADGKCICTAGYELGTDAKCSVKANAKFIGIWTAPETCTPSVDNNPYSITITEVSGDLTKVRISNFGRTSCGTDPLVVTADVSGTNLKSYTESCPSVNVTAGTANLSADGKTLNVSYTLTDGNGDTYTCSSAMIKQ